ncbi:MAG: sodium/solute symporter [Victivallales bacterium]|nr:sodium/solute symporter [Victivallales bacterium]
MHTADFIIFYAYLAAILLVGLLMRRKQRSEREFFLAGRSLGWFPLGISIMVTMLTSVNFAAFPIEIFQNGCYVLIALPPFIIAAFPVARIFIPFFRRQNQTSAYAFLEETFDVKTRCLASLIFMLWRIVWMAVALYASARILAAVTGDRLWLLILICGGLTLTYTAAGGLRAVVWTDVAQFFIILGGIAAGLIMAAKVTPGGFGGMFSNAFHHGVLRPLTPYDPAFFSLDPTIRITFWSGISGATVAFLARFGADQMVIQRYFAAKSLPDARKSFVFNIGCVLLTLGLLVIFGMAVHAYAVHAGSMGKFSQPMQYLVSLIKSLPYGGTGLMAAGLLAATMSSVDSGINACAMAWTKDFHHRFFTRNHADREFHIRYSVYFSVIAGILIIALAEAFIPVFGRRQSIFVMVNQVINSLGSPLLAVVIFGMLKRRPGADSVFWGVLGGTLFSIFFSLGVKNLALHYYAVINLLVTFGLCLVLNRLLPAGNKPNRKNRVHYSNPDGTHVNRG